MTLTVVITVVLPVFLLPAAVISFVFFCIGRLYLGNALAARKEVAAARSPLFSTLGDSTSGVTTIRAYGRSGAFAARYKRQTDNYNRVSKASQFYRVPGSYTNRSADATLRRGARQVARVASRHDGSAGLLRRRFALSLVGVEFGYHGLPHIDGYVRCTAATVEREPRLTSSRRARVHLANSLRRPRNQQERAQFELGPAHHPVLNRSRDGGGAFGKEGAASFMARFWRNRGAPDWTRSRCKRCRPTDSTPAPQFDEFSAKYSPDSEDVLKELSLQVKPGEKVSGASTSRPNSIPLIFPLTDWHRRTIRLRKVYAL